MTIDDLLVEIETLQSHLRLVSDRLVELDVKPGHNVTTLCDYARAMRGAAKLQLDLADGILKALETKNVK
jgi:ferritin-like protein